LSSEEFEEIKSDVVSSNVSSKNNLTKAFVYSQSGKCPPVDGSVFESFILKSKKLDKNDHSFNETGFNHRIEYGIEVKEDVVVGWTLEIECIKDFIESNGDCILRFDKDIRMLCITIKDVEVL
jgi:hypothetical protein